MSDTIGNVTNENGFSEASSDDLPLEAILDEIQQQATPSDKESNKDETVNAVMDKTAEEKEMSPLERLKAEKENGSLTGVVVSNQALEQGMDKAVQSSSPMEEYRTLDMEEKFNEMDETVKKRQAAVLIKQPADQVEYIQMIEEIEAIYFENGQAKLPKKLIEVEMRYLMSIFVSVKRENQYMMKSLMRC